MEIVSFPTPGEVSPTGGIGGGQGASAGSGGFDWISALLKLASASGGQQQQQLPVAQLPQPAQQVEGQNVPVFNIAGALPQTPKQGQSTDAIIGILADMFFGPAASTAVGKSRQLARLPDQGVIETQPQGLNLATPGLG